jgi:large subunit ribosomal protein L29
MATAAEIVELDVDELEIRLNETRRELFNLRFQLATGQLDNFSRMNHVRKDIARLLTEIRAREIAEAEGLAVEDIPVHQAAARQRAEDKALGRTRVPAAERRAAERAEEDEGAEAEDEDAAERAEITDAEITDAEVDEADDADAEDGAEDEVEKTDTVTAQAAPVGSTDEDVEEEG